MSTPPILASLLDATLPDYAALVAENARLREAEGNYLGALRTANATIARLESKLAAALELVGNLSAKLDTGEHANHALRRNLRAAEGHVELIDNQALLLQDQVGEQWTAIETALTDLRGVLRRWQRGAGERELADISHAYATLSSTLAATAPEEGA